MSDIPTSGAISLNQMHTEVDGVSGTIASINDADIRALIGKASGATMSFNEWYGASSALETQTVTVGFAAAGQYTPYKYGTGYTGIVVPDNAVRNIGNCVDGTLAIRSNKYIINLCFQGGTHVVLAIKNGGSNITNGGFTTMNIAGTNYSRSSATFFHNLASGNRFTSWMWSTTSNPFGTTTGATKVVTFT